MSTESGNNFDTAKFGEKLRFLRLSLPGGPSLEAIGKRIGFSKATLSRYESGESEAPVSLLERLVPEAGAAAVADLIPGLAQPGVSGVLPEHVQEAYKVVRDAIAAQKRDINTMNSDRVGLVIGLVAEEAAKGNLREARQTVIRRVEVLLWERVP